MLEGADIEIIDKMKPYSLVINAYDYFDIEKPITSDIKFTLPPNARKVYANMHRESLAKINEEVTVSAANMGALILKCRQVASGHVKDEDGTAHKIHEAKLDALADLIEMLDGQPLVVAYWFNKDLDMLKERFPHGKALRNDNSQQQVLADWNAGKIPLLFLHPQSAGHGISLQHGGNNICIYTIDWNSEYYEQVIERLGPTRQKQSGYDRPVFIHRLIAAKTWDEIIVNRLDGKFSTSDAFKEALTILD